MVATVKEVMVQAALLPMGKLLLLADGAQAAQAALLPMGKLLLLADGAQAVQAALPVTVKRVGWVNHLNPQKVLRDLLMEKSKVELRSSSFLCL
jgi:hypothetical protein